MTGCWCSTADAASLFSFAPPRPTGYAGRPCCTMTARFAASKAIWGRIRCEKKRRSGAGVDGLGEARLGKIVLPPCVIFAFPRTGRIMPAFEASRRVCCKKWFPLIFLGGSLVVRFPWSHPRRESAGDKISFPRFTACRIPPRVRAADWKRRGATRHAWLVLLAVLSPKCFLAAGDRLHVQHPPCGGDQPAV